MRQVLLLALALMLVAGCASKANDTLGSTTTGAPASSTTTGHATPTTSAATSQSTTTSSSAAPTGNGNVSVTHRAVVQRQHFAGDLPAATTGADSECSNAGVPEPDSICPTYTFTMPANGLEVTVWYNTTYNGPFTADVYVTDPEGNAVTSLDTCGLPPPGPTSLSCMMDLKDEIPAGEWKVTLAWQAGESTESYTIDVIGWAGVPGAA